MNAALHVALSPLRGVFFLAMVVGNMIVVSLFIIITFAVLLSLYVWDQFFATFFNGGGWDE